MDVNEDMDDDDVDEEMARDERRVERSELSWSMAAGMVKR